MPDPRPVIIIGSGPAGLTAAIYTARANLSPLVIEGEPSSTSDQPGGQLMLTTEVENFPGFPDGVMGPELMMQFRDQASRFGAEIVTAKVTRVDLSQSPFGVWVGDDEHRAESVIVATGAQSLMLGLESENRLIGHGLSTCATCDGFFFRGHEIGVVGGGDSAMEEALFLTKFASKVTIIHRRDSLRGVEDHAGPGPRQREDRVPVGHRRHRSRRRQQARGRAGREREDREHRRLSRSPGCSSRSATCPTPPLFKGQLDMDDAGYLITHDGAKTNVPGVFACGDVQDHVYRQAITAAGSGCMAAIDAERWLEARHG